MGILDDNLTPEQKELARLEDMYQRMQSGNYVPTAADIEADPSAWVAGQQPPPMAQPPQQPQPMAQPPQQQSPVQGLLSDPAQQGGGFQPTMSPQMMTELYGIMAAGADDPTKIGTGYTQRMQYNDMLKNQARQTQASQARTSGFNPIVDSDGKVWFPKREADGTTGLSPALDNNGQQIKTDPRFSTIDMGGGSTARIQTSGGAAGTGPEVLTTPDQVQGNKGTADQIAHRQKAQRELAGLESYFAREGGAFEIVGDLINHPSRELMTGGSTVAGTPWSYIPGTSARDFRQLEDKISSQAFVNSIAELRQRGGTVGQVTEMEGMKLQMAGLSLQRAVSEGRYLDELKDFQLALARFIMTARQEAGQDVYAPSVTGGIDLSFLKGDDAEDPTAGMTDAQKEAWDKY